MRGSVLHKQGGELEEEDAYRVLRGQGERGVVIKVDISRKKDMVIKM